MARILINHGWTNRRPQGGWARNLAIAARAAGHHVVYPQFPNPDQPVLEEWQDLLLAELEHTKESGSGEIIFIGHSLGCINWIQAATTGKIAEPIDRVLLVAPADPELLDEVPGMNVDLSKPAVRSAILASASSVSLVASDEDRWLPRGIHATFGDHLGLTPHVVQGAGHFTLTDGWGDWQGIIDWIDDPKADLSKR